jgi:hypothetical protein
MAASKEAAIECITYNYKNYLSREKVIGSFRENPASIQRIVDDLANRGCIRINVHSDACSKVSDDTLSCYLKRVSR